MSEQPKNGGCCDLCNYAWVGARPPHCPMCGFTTASEIPDGTTPRTEREVPVFRCGVCATQLPNPAPERFKCAVCGREYTNFARSEGEALDRYAEAHVGDTGHEVNAPRPPAHVTAPAKGDLAQHIFDTLLAANRLYVEQLRRDKA